MLVAVLALTLYSHRWMSGPSGAARARPRMFEVAHTAEVISTSADGHRANTTSGLVHAPHETPAYHQDDPATNAARENHDFSYDLGDMSFAPEISEPVNDGIALTPQKRYENSVRNTMDIPSCLKLTTLYIGFPDENIRRKSRPISGRVVAA